MGWELAIATGTGLSGIDLPGIGGVTATFVWSMHELVRETFGMIDWGVMSRIATDTYSDYFDTWNPYEDDS